MMKTCISIIMMAWVFCALAQSPIVYLKYDEASGTQVALDEAGGLSFQISNTFDKPERVSGVTGKALRTDGFSTWASRDLTTNFGGALTVETWISLESYPSDHEVPYGNLTPSAIISQMQSDQGFQIGINTFGVWWFSVNVNGQKYTCQASNPFPLYEWVHVAGVVDAGSSIMRLYLNGQQVASASIPSGGAIQEASAPLIVGKSNVDTYSGIFLLNAISAAIDETKVYDVAKSAATISTEYQAVVSNIPTTGFESVSVPASRFANDIQRPIYHAMPAANWTNEPHGMVEYNGQYHLFYQRTPNGPFKTMMHWGHMISSDFVNWEHEKDALWPTLGWSATTGYDMKGIWSGDVVVENGTAHAFYTNVNHTGPYNPGIAHATSSGGELEYWTKQGPVINRQYVNDFRDPYLWKEGSTWHMIIGAAVTGSGGLDYYTSTDLSNWTHQSQFSSVSFGQMDVGSVIWEMPVFESLSGGKHILIVNPIGGSRGKYGPNYTRAVYWVGSWSGGVFTPDYNEPKNLDLIHGHLSPTVARNVDGNLVGIGIVDERWNSQAQLDAGWCHTFSLPRVYSLLSDGETLGQRPAPELESLRIPGSQISQTNLSVSGTQPISANGQSLELIVELDPNTTADRFGVNFYVSDNGQEITRLYYDAVNEQIILDKRNSSLSPADEEKVLITADYDESAFGKPEKFHIYLDHSVVDIFINDKAAFSNRIYPTQTSSSHVELVSEGSSTTFTSVESWLLGKGGEGVSVTAISLNKNSAIVPLTTSTSLVATLSPANASDKQVTWISSNEAVATVSDGIITPVAKGSAVITAKSVSGGFTATCNVMVVDAPTYSIYDFESGDLTGWTVSGAAFTDADVTNDTEWWGGSFQHEGDYHLHGFKDGGDGQTGSIQTGNFILGAHGQISLLIGGGNDINNLFVGLYRASDDALVASVTGKNDETYSEVIIDGVAALGVSCYLKAVDNSTGGFGHLNLDDVRVPIQTGSPIAATGVSLDQTSLILAPQETATLNESISPSNATNQSVAWASSNTSVATVSSSGLVTAVSVGEAIITVTTDDGGFTEQATVMVANQDYLIYDFESGDLTGWQISGEAFVSADVTTAEDWGWGGPFTPQGSYHLWGVSAGSDTQTGSLKSQDFILGGDGVISFLIGGGFDINTLYLALIRKSDGAILMKATGDDNDSENYVSKQLDASAYLGVECYLKLVDNATGGWGHINLDNLVVPIDNVPATGVSLNASSISVTEGSSKTLVATVAPANSTNRDVCWSSSNTSVASVSDGVVSAISEGTATITATTIDGGFTAQTAINVIAQDYLVYDFESGNLNGWTVSGSAFVAADVTSDSDWGWSGPFHPQGTYHLWSAKSGSDAQTGSIQTQNFVLDGSGVITFLIGGGFDINTLYLGLYRVSDDALLMKMTGENNDSEDYSSRQFNASDYVGVTCYLKAVDNATGGWGHINLDNIRIPVASVDVTGVTLDPSSVTITEGFSTILSATVLPVGASNSGVSWSSSNSSVATVNQSGMVTALASGSTTITVTTNEGSYSDQTDVTVEAQQYLTYDFESGDLSGWTATGNAFVSADATSAANWGWGGPFNPQGTYHLWSVQSGGDSDTGTLHTQDFVLGGDGIITFMLGGGFDFNNVYLALVRKSDGAVLMKVTGDNNDSEDYTQKQFDASVFVGVECYMQLVDNATGGWGHINLDNLVIPTVGNATARITEEFEKAEETIVLRVYPNPVTEELYLDLPKEEVYQLSILSVDGREIRNQTMEGSKLDVRTLNPGTYLLVLSSHSQKHVFRIIKQ
ncbi:MAG: Ig-like domain-containing protein [Marinoscillum sp.]